MCIDYHIHTEHSWDGGGSISEFCLKALELGIDELGFSEHIDLDPIDPGYGYHDFAKIDRVVLEAREIFQHALTIKKGIEITYQEEFHDRIEEFIRKWDYDYTMVGIHLTNGIFYTSGKRTEDYFRSEPDPNIAFSFYFDELLRAVESGLIDIVAHMDVMKRHSIQVYGPFNPIDYAGRFERILGAIVERDCALEINSGDFANRGKGDIYPSDWILNRFHEMGGQKVTFGSDAHKLSALGGGYEIALNAAKRSGFEGWTIYTKRKSQMVSF